MSYNETLPVESSVAGQLPSPSLGIGELMNASPEQQVIINTYSEAFAAGHELGSLLVAESIAEVWDAKARLEEKVTNLTAQLDLDPKLGVLNYTAFTKIAQELINDPDALADREHQSFGLLVIDLDDFKAINTALGYDQADATCLIPTAEILQRYSQRSADLAGATANQDPEKSHTATEDIPSHASKAGRFGGEEFVMLLAGVDRNGLTAVAEKIKKEINAIRYVVGDEENQLGVSIGAIVLPPGADYTIGFQLATEAQMSAKLHKGKNLVVMASAYCDLVIDDLTLRNQIESESSDQTAATTPAVAG